MLGIFPQDDHNQTLRLKRFFMALRILPDVVCYLRDVLSAGTDDSGKIQVLSQSIGIIVLQCSDLCHDQKRL